MLGVKRRKALFLLLASSLLVLFPATSEGGTVRIKATGDKTWNPDFKSVPKGTKVIWKNPTDIRHTVTFYKGSVSKDTSIKAGEGTSKIFRKSGPNYYRCKIHSRLSEGDCSGMCGHVHVQ